MAIPTRRELLIPVLTALGRSGSGTTKELLPIVSSIVGLTETDLAKTIRSGMGKAQHQVGFTLSLLKKTGNTEYQYHEGNSTWRLTEAGKSALAEAEEIPEAAEAVTARLWEQLQAERRKHQAGQKADPGPTRSYEQGYAAGAAAGRQETKLLVRFWLDVHKKGGGQQALNELRKWANA